MATALFYKSIFEITRRFIVILSIALWCHANGSMHDRDRFCWQDYYRFDKTIKSVIVYSYFQKKNDEKGWYVH